MWPFESKKSKWERIKELELENFMPCKNADCLNFREWAYVRGGNWLAIHRNNGPLEDGEWHSMLICFACKEFDGKSMYAPLDMFFREAK